MTENRPDGKLPVWSLDRRSEGFPAALEDLGSRCPDRIYGCGSAGLVSGLAPETTVALVGGRKATPYALDAGRSLAAQLSEAGMVVVSGMAFGVDGAAHLGALDVRAPTVAVLASGPDDATPRGQRRVFNRILSTGGAVISEHPPGTDPHPSRFPERNRIMAAIAGMTIVVEAAERSGSLITAREAMALGREVGAVPGQIGMARSRGSNGLLADGACVIRDAVDVIDALLGPGAVVEPVTVDQDPELAGVIEALEDGIGEMDGLALATGVDPAALGILLGRLELAGRLAISPAGRYELIGSRPARVRR